MEFDLASCLWLVLVRVPLRSADECRATRQRKLPPVTTMVSRIMRDGRTAHIAHGFNYRVEAVLGTDAVRIAWKANGAPHVSTVEAHKPFVWIENGTTTVMACAFVSKEAARAWEACRRRCLVPPSQAKKAA